MTSSPDIPAALKAIQIARLLMVYNPLYEEGYFTLDKAILAAIEERTAKPDSWIPFRFQGRPGFIFVGADHVSGEYRSHLDGTERVLEMPPVEIDPGQPVTLMRLLREQLAAWQVERANAEAHAGVARLAGRSFTQVDPILHNLLSAFAENQPEGLQGMKCRMDELFKKAARAFEQLELCGEEFGYVVAFVMLAEALIKRALSGDDRKLGTAEAAAILLRAVLPIPKPSSSATMDAFLRSLESGGYGEMISGTTEFLEELANSKFDEAKSNGITADLSANQASDRVCADFRYAMGVWNDMHHDLRYLLPISWGGQILARFLIKHAELPPKTAERMRRAYKQLDELTVVVTNSLRHAVRTHDPRARAATIGRIRETRRDGGDKAARAVIRNYTEQQAFYPRVWSTWLDKASRGHQLA